MSSVGIHGLVKGAEIGQHTFWYETGYCFSMNQYQAQVIEIASGNYACSLVSKLFTSLPKCNLVIPEGREQILYERAHNFITVSNCSTKHSDWLKTEMIQLYFLKKMPV